MLDTPSATPRKSTVPRASAVVDLNQDPVLRPRMTTKDGFLPTLTCNSRGLYSYRCERFISSTEMLLAQGFPSTRWAAKALGVGFVDLNDLTEAARAKLAGNAMHGACMGAVLSWVAAFVSLKPCDGVRAASPARSEPPMNPESNAPDLLHLRDDLRYSSPTDSNTLEDIKAEDSTPGGGSASR